MLGLSLAIQFDFSKNLGMPVGSARASARGGVKRTNEPLPCSGVGSAESASECAVYPSSRHGGGSRYDTHVRTCTVCIKSLAILRLLT